MTKKSTLNILLEDLLTRYRLGGFLVGDEIQFKPSIKKSEHYKGMSDANKQLLDDMIKMSKDGDAIIKISGINQKPFMQGTGVTHPKSFTIGVDEGGGRYIYSLTIPGHFVNEIIKVDNGNNVANTIAPNRQITYPADTRPVEVTQEDEEGKGSTTVPKQKAQRMPKKDNKIAKGKTPKETDYTKNIKSTMEVGKKLKT